MKSLHVNPVITLISFLLLLGAGTASAQSVTPPLQDSQPSMETSGAEEGMQGSAPVEPPARSRVDSWFNRSGSGLFIALTPFATGVTLLVLLLLILLPLLFRTAYRRGKSGYFKTISTRQRRIA
jgi:hypothetical protein